MKLDFMDFKKRMALYIKVMHYEDIERVFGRNKSFNPKFEFKKTLEEYPLTINVHCEHAYAGSSRTPFRQNRDMSLNVSVPRDFFYMNDSEQCNILSDKIKSIHKAQKNV